MARVGEACFQRDFGHASSSFEQSYPRVLDATLEDEAMNAHPNSLLEQQLEVRQAEPGYGRKFGERRSSSRCVLMYSITLRRRHAGRARRISSLRRNAGIAGSGAVKRALRQGCPQRDGFRDTHRHLLPA
jgi:hypothetical protein